MSRNQRRDPRRNLTLLRFSKLGYAVVFGPSLLTLVLVQFAGVPLIGFPLMVALTPRYALPARLFRKSHFLTETVVMPDSLTGYAPTIAFYAVAYGVVSSRLRWLDHRSLHGPGRPGDDE